MNWKNLQSLRIQNKETDVLLSEIDSCRPKKNFRDKENMNPEWNKYFSNKGSQVMTAQNLAAENLLIKQQLERAYNEISELKSLIMSERSQNFQDSQRQNAFRLPQNNKKFSLDYEREDKWFDKAQIQKSKSPLKSENSFIKKLHSSIMSSGNNKGIKKNKTGQLNIKPFEYQINTLEEESKHESGGTTPHSDRLSYSENMTTSLEKVQETEIISFDNSNDSYGITALKFQQINRGLRKNFNLTILDQIAVDQNRFTRVQVQKDYQPQIKLTSPVRRAKSEANSRLFGIFQCL